MKKKMCFINGGSQKNAVFLYKIHLIVVASKCLRKHNLIMHIPGIDMFSLIWPTICILCTLDIYYMHVYTKIEAKYAEFLPVTHAVTAVGFCAVTM